MNPDDDSFDTFLAGFSSSVVFVSTLVGFCGADATDPPFGRVPMEVKVILQDIDVGTEGNRMMTIGARQKRFRVGLKF